MLRNALKKRGFLVSFAMYSTPKEDACASPEKDCYNHNGGNKLMDFLAIRKVLNLGLKAEKQLQNENHTEDWALGSHPRDSGHVTH